MFCLRHPFHLLLVRRPSGQILESLVVTSVIKFTQPWFRQRSRDETLNVRKKKTKKKPHHHSREVIFETFLIQLDSQWNEPTCVTATQIRRPGSDPAFGCLTCDKEDKMPTKLVYNGFFQGTDKTLRFTHLCKVQVHGRNDNINTWCARLGLK